MSRKCKKMLKKSSISQDNITRELSKSFDYTFEGKTTTKISIPKLPNDFSVGLVVGASGSGKTTILHQVGQMESPEWDSKKAICSHFESANNARDMFSAVGLNSVPCWMRPYECLSNGERHRADIARQLKNGAVIDEFTSVVDRTVAKSLSVSIKKHIDRCALKGVVLASCHYDIIEWLQPDWVYDASQESFLARGSERPAIKIDLLPCRVEAWSAFSKHHYLSADINKSAKCWLAFWNEQPVGFASAIAFPNNTIKSAYRGHRTVVLPDYQGLGIGCRISDAVGEIMLADGKRYFSKTANYAMGEYRNNSAAWRGTTKNMMDRQDDKSGSDSKESKYKENHADRFCYSHEYVGKTYA